MVEFDAKQQQEHAERIIEAPERLKLEYQAESLQKRRQKEIRRRRDGQTQVSIGEFVTKADKECQHQVQQGHFACQTFVKFNEWWTQTQPMPVDDAQIQTDSCFHEDKQVQSEQMGVEKVVQTLAKGTKLMWTTILKCFRSVA